MKMFKKVGAAVAAGAMVAALALTGCGSSDTGTASDTGSAATTDSGSYSLVNEGKLTIGTSAEYEPFEYMEDGEYKGFDLDLAKAIADKLGLELQIENVDFDGIVAGVASGTQYDLGIAAITDTPDRREQVDFSDAYYTDDLSVVVMNDNTEVTGDNYAEQLNQAGVKIAVQSGSTAEAYVRENFPEAEPVSYKNATDCFSALQSDGAVALVTNRSVAAQLVATSFNNEQVIASIPTDENYAIAVSKENAGLKDAVNQALKELTEDGTVDDLMSQYNIK